MSTDQPAALTSDPLAQSLPGEFVRILLIGTAGFSALASAIKAGVDPSYFVPVVGNIIVLACAMTTRFAGALRGTFLICFAIAVTLATLQSSGNDRWREPLIFFSPASLLVCLAILAVRDFLIAIPSITQRASLRSIAAGFAIAGLLVYMVLVPSIAAILETFRDRPLSYEIDELSISEQLRIRSAKFAVFAIFAYVGACVASFVNVVASSAPRGGEIAFRTSACPKCGTAIRRIDNLPIFSYLNLAGRCRNCAAVIPVRYFIVEVIGAIIFGTLFLFELVTGAANVPGFPHYQYTGIVWIILYTKWPVVGIYFYHAALFTCLMMLALMDLDRLRCPRWLSGSMLLIFAGLSVVAPTLQPVAFYAQTTAGAGNNLPAWAVAIANCSIGGLAGWLLTSLIRHLGRHRPLRRFVGHQFALSGGLIGIALGWQATVTIVTLGAIAMLTLVAIAGRNTRWLKYSATAVLSTVAMLHQPAWKWLADLW